MKKMPLVSVIVPTYNSSQFLDACLQSIKDQTYQNIELIVVDNNSTDNTKDIARKYTDKVFNKGPERSAQRNYGVKKSKGDYVLIIDSDMELTKDVVKACAEKISSNNELKGIIIPEESFGEGFWAQCKKLERSFYVGVDWMEAARFFDKKTYLDVGGYNEDMVSGEDWDLSQRVESQGRIDRIDKYILHNEGRLKLSRTLKKKYYYAQKFSYYKSQTSSLNAGKQSGLIARYKLFFSQPLRLFKNPITGLGMLWMKTNEFLFGGIGYISRKRR